MSDENVSRERWARLSDDEMQVLLIALYNDADGAGDRTYDALLAEVDHELQRRRRCAAS